jgi:FMN phosphatase YigB (HAD superfamily)
MAPNAASDAALVFDVGGVLIAHDNEVLFQRLASGCTSEDAHARIRAESTDTRYGTGETPISVLHKKLVHELGYSGDWDQFTEDFCCHFTLDPDMLTLADKLAKSNRLILFSNTNEVHWLNLREVFGRFESYASHEIGDVKPNATAFETFAAIAGIDPACSIFVDDNADNVEAAKRAGFTAHRFTSRTELEEFLRASNISWSDQETGETT